MSTDFAAQVKQKVDDGLSPVCATCAHYWNARAAKLSGDRCLSVDDCRGPIRGGVFHEYQGPMKHFRSFCFVCSKQATRVVQVGEDTINLIGICDDHLPMLWEPRGKNPPPLYARGPEGPMVPVESLKPPPKKTLLTLMKDVEDHRRGGGSF